MSLLSKRKLALLYFLASFNAAAVAAASVHEDVNSGLLTWESDSDGFSVQLIQLLPDFIRAIYAKHDFPSSEIERIANFCVYGTIIKNTSDETVSYDVREWTYQTKDKTLPVKTKTEWLEQWRRAGIVFSWTLLPDKGDFAVGDWQQGFTTIKVPRDETFDFTYRWSINGKMYSDTIKSMSCAPDI